MRHVPSAKTLLNHLYPGTIHLQGVGRVEAKPAKEFKIGESFMWNYGSTSEIKRIVKETSSYITFEIEYEAYSGKMELGERRLKKDRLVGIGNV